VSLQQRFARLVTNLVVRFPFLWRVFRGTMRRQFDQLAPVWDATRVDPAKLAPLQAALESLPDAPARVLDVGTGTGVAARLATRLFPGAKVTGVDASPGMIEEARRLATGETYEVADASKLPFAAAGFDLVTLNNMIPFFDEIARVTAPGGTVAICYTRGSGTPIWVPPERVQNELASRGFAHVADFPVGPGIAVLARKDEVA
jgi:ubiquinone/menaquinone biosynthesis C-methylase UbiE